MQASRSENGFVLISAAVLLVGLMAFLGLAFDVGYLQWTRRRLQVAADSAAIAGTNEILLGSSSSTVTSAAKTDAGLNGFTDGSNGVTVTVNNPPLSGSDAGNTSAVEVIVTQNAPVYFLSVFGQTTMTVKARGVSKPGPNTNCVYVLNPSGSNAFTISGAVNVNLSCGAIVDSTSSSGMSVNGAVNFTGYASVAGGYSANGAITWNPGPPQTGATPQSDPLSYIPAPAVGSCTYTNYTISGAFNSQVSPGVYCNGISISGAGSITFNSGTYVLLGGGLKISGAVNISGTSVTFYNTQGGGYTYGPVSISGASNSTLSAPTTGSLAGMLFFQDRTLASPAASSITGASNDNFVGALYFPTSTLTYSGASNGQYTILVAKILTFNGAAVVGANYSSLPGGSPVRGDATLSE